MASLETTLPPTPLRDLLAADGASVYVFSADEDLARVAQEAAGEHFPISTVADWTELLRMLQGRCQIVLLDAEAIPGGLERGLAEFDKLGATPIILVAAGREQSQRHIALLSERRIHRLLIKPAAVGITRLLLESAVTRYLQRRELQRRQPPPDAPLVAEMAGRPGPGHRALLWPTWIVATALVALLLGAMLVAGWSPVRFGVDRSPPPAALGRASAPDSGGRSAGADKTASGARQAPPAAAPASPPAQAPVVPARAPSSATETPAAVAGVPATAPQTSSAASASSALAPASSALAPASPVAATPTPSAGTPASAAAPISTASAATAADAAATSADAAASSADAAPVSAAAASPLPPELASLLTLGRTRLRAGQLLEPQGDSADAYFGRASSLAPDNPAVLKLRLDLAAALADEARVALGRQDLDGAARMADEAFKLGADPESLATLQVDLQAARQSRDLAAEAQLLAAADQRLGAGEIISPAGDSALDDLAALQARNPALPGLDRRWAAARSAVAARVHEAVAAADWLTAETWTAALEHADPEPKAAATLRDDVEHARLQQQYLAAPAPAGQLHLIESASPEYPEAAQRRGLQGWVELRFVVGTDGIPRDVEVVDSHPRNVFDEAAVAALGRQRYEPFERDGHRYARLATLRMSFQLK